MRIAVVLAILCAARAAVATSYAPPEEHDEPSPNGAYVLHVSPKDRLHTVRSGTTALWSFAHDVGFSMFVVANDGKTVAVVHWHFVQLKELDDPAVEIWTAGGLARTYSVRELVAQPGRTTGVAPIGRFWRRWRRAPAFDGRYLDIETTGLFAYRFDLGGDDVERSLTALGVIRWAVSLVGFAIAVALVWLARSTRRTLEFASDRKRTTRAAISPTLAALGLAFFIGGIPLVPAELVVGEVTFVVWIAGVLTMPFSLIAAARLTGRSRLVYLVATPVLVLASVVLRLV